MNPGSSHNLGGRQNIPDRGYSPLERLRKQKLWE
jgi:hypothetical protein